MAGSSPKSAAAIFSQYSRHANTTSPNGLVRASTAKASEIRGSVGGLRSARSTPDICGMVEEEKRIMPTSHTPPPLRTKTPPPQPSGVQVMSLM